MNREFFTANVGHVCGPACDCWKDRSMHREDNPQVAAIVAEVRKQLPAAVAAAMAAHYRGGVQPITAHSRAAAMIAPDVGDVIRGNALPERSGPAHDAIAETDAAARATGKRPDQAVETWSRGDHLPAPIDMGDYIRAKGKAR